MLRQALPALERCCTRTLPALLRCRARTLPTLLPCTSTLPALLNAATESPSNAAPSRRGRRSRTALAGAIVADPPPPRRGGPADARDARRMRAPAGSPARTRKLEISWCMAAKRARIPCGIRAGFWTARCSSSKFDDAASARGRDFMMRTAGARIMSISGARRAQTSPGLPADAHDAGFWGPRWEGLLPGARTRAAHTSRSP